MKKVILCSSIQIALAASALAQGTVVFENALSTGNIGIGYGGGGYSGGQTITVALLWAPGTSLVPQSSFTQIGTFTFQNNAGYFVDPAVLTTGAATAGGTAAIFEVQGWLGTYTSAADAQAHGALVGQSVEFVNNTGNPAPPATPPVNTTGWDGNLYTPEPSTLLLSASGGLLLWAKYRRRKQA